MYALEDYLKPENDAETVQAYAERAGRTHCDLVLLFAPAREVGTRSYLLTWNPRRWSWEELPKMARKTAEGRMVRGQWSCGRNKHIEPGSRLFLIRQGVQPKGIIGSGIATSRPFVDEHWQEVRKQALYIKLKFDHLLDPENGDGPLMVTELDVPELKGIRWTTQVSGIEIRSGAERLEQLWRDHLSEIHGTISQGDEPEGFEGKQSLAYRLHKQREQRLRRAKIDQEMRANGGRLRCTVPGCGFDFFEKYGELGRGFAHVHHLEPFSGRAVPSLTRLADLAIVCPNCHAMIHRGGKCRDVETLIKKLRRGG
jgi:5-methylcytosine-specific restriction protein A